MLILGSSLTMLTGFLDGFSNAGTKRQKRAKERSNTLEFIVWFNSIDNVWVIKYLSVKFN
jgi:hypothetical protein